MISRRAALVLAPAALALAACSSSSVTSGSPQSAASATSSAPTSSAATSSAPTSSAPTSSAATSSAATSTAAGGGSATASSADAKELYQKLQAGFAKVRSAHFDFAFDVGGQNVHATGTEKFKDKKVNALQLAEKVGTTQIAFIIVDGKAYAKLPAGAATSGKPWTLLSRTSSNATIRKVATGIGSSLSSTSVNSYTLLANAADSVKKVGRTTVAGQSVEHYALVVDPTRIPTANGGSESAAIGKIPVQLYVDSSDRPVQVTEKFTVGSNTARLTATFTKYNEPVTIKAPPASQVGTK